MLWTRTIVQLVQNPRFWPKVVNSSTHTFIVLIILITADLEAEDIDLGNNVNDDLALDVDGLMKEVEDPEALDSDDEDQLDEELGLDDYSEGEGQFNFIIYVAQINETCSTYAHCSPLFAFAE